MTTSRRAVSATSWLYSAASVARNALGGAQRAHRTLHSSAWRSSDVPITSDPLANAAASSSAAASTSTAQLESQPHTSGPLSSRVQYSYFVERAGPMQESLPVYSELRNQGATRFTVVRKVGGDVHALSRDLLASLPWSQAPRYHKPYRPRSGRKMSDRPPSDADMHLWGDPTARSPIKVSSVNGVGKLTIAGDRVREVKQWLEERGF